MTHESQPNPLEDTTLKPVIISDETSARMARKWGKSVEEARDLLEHESAVRPAAIHGVRNGHELR